MTTRQITDGAAISNGPAYYVLAVLIFKGFVKLGNFKNNPLKGQYAYLLNPKGIHEKTRLTHSFIERKRKEFKILRDEIKALEAEAVLALGSLPPSGQS